MDQKKRKIENHKVILDGTAFYEIDLDCVREKQRRKNDKEYKDAGDTNRELKIMREDLEKIEK